MSAAAEVRRLFPSPFGIEALRPIQMSRADVLDTFYEGRAKFETTNDWIDFLLRSIGFEPADFNERAKRVAVLRMVPFVERNYNMVALGCPYHKLNPVGVT